jgi:tetratricopeptide (TPR) repeat protein
MANMEEILNQARQLYQSGEFARAEMICRQWLVAHPFEAEYHGQPASSYAEVYNALGKALYRQCQHDEAAKCFDQALQLNPGYAEAYFNLGNTQVRRGEIDSAIECFRNCLSLTPSAPGAYHNLANLYQKQGRLQEAIPYYEEAIHLRPEWAEAYKGLGNVYSSLGSPDKAVHYFSRAVRLAPCDADIHYNLGNAYRDDGQVAESVRCYQQALALKPDYAKAHKNIGEAYVALGQMKEAEFHFREALRVEPDFLATLCNMVQFGLAQRQSAEVEQIRRRLADAPPTTEDLIHIHFTLGELLDQSGAYDDAFTYFQQGNALRRDELQRTGTAFDVGAFHNQIQERIETFTPDYFATVRGMGLDSQVPIFIVGMPRSGTTLVEQILASHPEVYGAGELKDIGQLAAGLPALLGSPLPYPSCVKAFTSASVRDIAETCLRRLAERGGSARRVTDKMPGNYLHLGLITTMFPKAKIIHCVRDPMDVCLSCYFHFFRHVNFAWDLDDLGRYYREYQRMMAHWRAVLPVPIFDVVYEEMVAHTDVVSRWLVDFCGLQWSNSCLRFYENRRPVQTLSHLQVRKPIYTSSIGRWRHYEKYLEPLRKALDDDVAGS